MSEAVQQVPEEPSKTPEPEVEVEVVVDPATLPKVTLPILHTVHVFQSGHGFKRNVPDYQRYRKFCTSKLQRLRKNLRFTYGKKKFTFHQLTVSHVKNERYLLLPLINAERCWAYYLDLQREVEKEGAARVKFHALKRLKRAAKWAALLCSLCEVRADERTKLEATAYNAWMEGLVARELENWKFATEKFFVAQTVFAKLANVGPEAHRTIAQTRAENVEPLVAYCAYRMGGAASKENDKKNANNNNEAAGGKAALDPVLQAKLESYVRASAEAQAKQQSIQWEGREVEIPENAASMVTRARFEALDAASLESAISDPLALVKACAAYDKLLVSLASVLDLASKHPDNNWAKALNGWTKDQISGANKRRDALLVRVAALRVGLDGTGPWPSDEPAAPIVARGRLPHAEEFVSASKEYVGSGPVTCVDVARILDSLASHPVPGPNEKEEVRRAAAASVLRWKGLKALFLARHESYHSHWKEAFLLAKHALGFLEESAAMGQQGDDPSHSAQLAKKEALVVRRELRLIRVSASGSGAVEAKEELPVLEVSVDDVVSARVAPPKPAFFDLAGSEVKYPSLDSKLKKRGFFGLW